MAIPVAASIQILVREYVDLRTLSIKKDEDRGDEPPQSLHRWRRPLPTRLPRSLFNMKPAALAKRGILLAITGVSLYLLAPALLEVFGAWDRLDDISPLWFVGMIVLQAGSYASMWWVQKISVRAETSDRWSRPSWRPTPSAGWFRAAWRRREPCSTRCWSARACRRRRPRDDRLLAAGVRHAPGSPLLAVPAIATGVAVDPRLARAAEAGAIIFVAMFALGGGVRALEPPARGDRPGRADRAQQDHARPRAAHQAASEAHPGAQCGREGARCALVAGTAARRGALVLDYLTLLAALYAVGANPRASSGAAGLLHRPAPGHAPAHARRPGLRGGGAHGNAGPGGRGGRRGGGGHPGVPARVVYADPTGAVAVSSAAARCGESEPAPTGRPPSRGSAGPRSVTASQRRD